MTLRHSRLAAASAAAALAAFAVFVLVMSDAWSQSARAIKIVVPYPPAGGADVVARVLVNEIGNMGGPTMIVENRPGAGTAIGTEDVVRAAPDGNTLLLGNNALLLVPQLRKVDYDPLKSLEPICAVAATPMIAIVNNASPYHTLNELIDAARAKPGALTFGAAIGAPSQISYEMLLHRANVRMTLVPFTGTPPEVEAVFAGHIDTAIVDYPPAAGLLQSGKLRALAVGSAARLAWLPDLPTVSELGYKHYEIEVWYGVFAPAHTPPQTVVQFAQWFSKAAQMPQARARLLQQGIDTDAVCGADFAAYLLKRYEDYGRVIRDANIKVE